MGLVTNIAAYAPTLKSVSPSIHTLLQRMTAVWCPLAVQGVRVAAQKQAPMMNLALSAVVSGKEEVEVEEGKGV